MDPEVKGLFDFRGASAVGEDARFAVIATVKARWLEQLRKLICDSVDRAALNKAAKKRLKEMLTEYAEVALNMK